MAKYLLLWFSLFFVTAFSQQLMLPIGTNFRDLNFAPTSAKIKGPAFFPVSEKQSDFYNVFRDSSKRYSTFGHFLYQRQLIEISDKEINSRLWITPLLDLSYGTALKDTNRRISQNTRGLRMEGQFGKKWFFTTSFYENQAFLPDYQRDFVLSRGEQYVAADSTYFTANAVIPGAARTKPFKDYGFDYGYATGMVSFFATENLEFHVGNQPVFIGSGYRSLFWSDNSPAFPYIRARWKISSRIELQALRGKGMNLLRRPFTTNSEAYYEKKSLSLAAVYFQATEWLNIGIIEGGMWSRGDSISQKNVEALYYVPLPGVAAVQQEIDGSSYGIIGIDLNASLGKQVLYGQFALSPNVSNSLVYQAGIRVFPTKNPHFQVQAEYNHADKNAYQSADPRINYSHYNLAIAHPANAGFDEFLLRISFEKKYWFATVQTNYFKDQTADPTLLMPLYNSNISTLQQVFNQYLEAGYRFNKSYGLEIFAGFQYRKSIGFVPKENAWISAGIRTKLNNHYFDF